MTSNQIATLKNAETGNLFGNDFAGYYDISADEAERIASKSRSLAEFEAIWANEGWWKAAE